MQEFTCSSCRQIFRSRLRERLVHLKNGRRRFHASTSQSNGKPRYAESWYWETKPPTRQELAAASHFFKHHLPFRQWTGDTWRYKENQSEDLLIPEVIFLGRSNVGKSSLINALTGQDLNRVSATPGATQVMAAWTLAAKNRDGGAIQGWDGDVSSKLSLVDMPGYSFGSKAEWSKSIMDYLVKRRNIRRAFLLLDSVVGATGTDRHMIEVLRGLTIPYQIVATKCDRLIAYKGSQDDIRSALTTLRAQAQLETHQDLGLGEIISVGHMQDAAKGERASKASTKAFGVQNLQWAVLRAAGLDTYAIQKASAHGVLKSVAAGEQSSLRIGGPATSDAPVVDKTPATDDAPKAIDDSLQPPVADLSVEDFMREILGASASQSPASPTGTSIPKTQSPAAKIYNGVMPIRASNNGPGAPAQPKATSDDRTRAEIALDAALQYAQDHGLNNDSLPTSKGSKWTDSNPARREALLNVREPSKRAESLSPHGRDDFDGKKRPSAVPFRRLPLKRATTGSDALRAMAEPVSRQRATQASNRAAGKGVTRDVDAFEALFDEPKVRTQWTQRTQQTQRTPKGRSRVDTKAVNTKPALAGKGVVQGMDAFEAMFDEKPKSSSQKQKKRN